MMRIISVCSALALLGCSDPSRSDGAPTPSNAPSTTVAPPPAATASSNPMDCAALADHWRTVWTTEARAGLERRARRAAGYTVQQWTALCNKVVPATSVLEDLAKLRTFSALRDEAQTGGENRRVLLATMQSMTLRSQVAYTSAASGLDQCEDAFVDAAFCGEASDVSKRIEAVRELADKKDAKGCQSYAATLSPKCPGQ